MRAPGYDTPPSPRRPPPAPFARPARGGSRGLSARAGGGLRGGLGGRGVWRPYTPPVPTHADVDAGRGHVGAIVEVIFDGAPRVELLRRHHRHRRRHGLPQQRRQPPRFRERQSRSAPPSRALRRAAELVDGGCPPSQGALWGRPCPAGGGGGGRGLCAAVGRNRPGRTRPASPAAPVGWAECAAEGKRG